MDPLSLIIPLVSAAIVLTLFIATMRTRSNERARQAAYLASTDDGPEVTLGSDVPQPARGSCRITGCGRHAEFRAPVIVSVRPQFDWMLRRLGATPMVKFQLQLEPKDLSAPVELCPSHRELSRTALEIELGEIPSRYVRLNNDVLRHMTSFHRNELFAKLEADAFEDSKRKKKRGVTGVTATVVDISQKRAPNGA